MRPSRSVIAILAFGLALPLLAQVNDTYVVPAVGDLPGANQMATPVDPRLLAEPNRLAGREPGGLRAGDLLFGRRQIVAGRRGDRPM